VEENLISNHDMKLYEKIKKGIRITGCSKFVKTCRAAYDSNGTLDKTMFATLWYNNPSFEKKQVSTAGGINM